MPRTKLTVVCLDEMRGECAVIEAPPGSQYPIGGHRIIVGAGELRTAIERPLQPVAAREEPDR